MVLTKSLKTLRNKGFKTLYSLRHGGFASHVGDDTGDSVYAPLRSALSRRALHV